MRGEWETAEGVATCSQVDATTTLEVRGGIMTVTRETGSGHAAQYTIANIPMGVVVEMMRAAGYSVARPPG